MVRTTRRSMSCMPPHPVENLAALEIVEERVDREVAPDRVFVRLAEERCRCE